jgi:phage shock protein PspC (stress-responsive transcriptional regulator)
MTSASPPPPPAPPLEPPAWQPPPPPGAWARPQLRRSRSDKVIGGVGGGLAEYSGIDALLWRVGFVALALAGGTGVFVYLLLWLLMPADPTAGTVHATSPAAVRGPKPPPGPRSPVPGITLAALLIVLGLLALATNAGDWDPGPRVFFGAGLLVVGLGLVASAFVRGRSARGGLIALGVVLSAALFSVSALPDGGSVGERTYRPAVADDVRPVYDLGLGELTLDLTSVDLSDLDEPVRTRIEGGVGEIQVLVPRSADVRVTADVGAGDIRGLTDDEALDGQLLAGTGPAEWTDDGRPEFVIEIDLGIGDLEVSRG